MLIDLFSRRVVGWAVSDRLKKDLALRALRMALVTRHPPSGLIHHSDRGSQYCSIDYQAVLRKHGLLISMSGKGNCYDNAVVETFFKTIKSELIWAGLLADPAARPRTRWPDTSTGSTIRSAATRRSATRARSTSRWRAESEQSALH